MISRSVLNLIIISIKCGIVVVKVNPIERGGDGQIDFLRSMFALQAHGKTGPGVGFGYARFGHSKYGADNQTGGILQRRVTGYNQYLSLIHISEPTRRTPI